MVIAKPSLLDRLTSRKFLFALGVFVISVLLVMGVIPADQETRDLAWWGTIGAPALYGVIQGAIDFIKTKKVYEAQAVLGAPQVLTAPTSGPDPHTAIAADDVATTAAAA